jgi:hypothetical protein
VALLAVNAGIVAGVHMVWETRATHTLRRQTAELRDSGLCCQVGLAGRDGEGIYRISTESKETPK